MHACEHERARGLLFDADTCAESLRTPCTHETGGNDSTNNNQSTEEEGGGEQERENLKTDSMSPMPGSSTEGASMNAGR